MNYDVFISYSRRDYQDENNQVIPGNIVSQIKDLFDANNISYWFDEDGVFSGDAFAPIIARNIKSSSIFLFISSESSNRSEWTSNEIATAHTYKKKIIPFKYDDSIYNDSVIIYIARLDYIDYPTHPDKALQRLLVSVQTYLQEEKAKKERERIEEERRRKAEISRQEKAAKIQGIHDQIEKLENRKFEIEQEILTQEKTLTDLRNEKRIIETNITELQEEESTITGKSTQTKEASAAPPTAPTQTKAASTSNNFFVQYWNQLKAAMAMKHWTVNTIHILLLVGCLAFLGSGLVECFPDFDGWQIMVLFGLLTISLGLYKVIQNSLVGMWMTIIPLIIFTSSPLRIGGWWMWAISSIVFLLSLFFIRKNKQSTWSVMKKHATDFHSITLWVGITSFICFVCFWILI